MRTEHSVKHMRQIVSPFSKQGKYFVSCNVKRTREKSAGRIYNR